MIGITDKPISPGTMINELKAGNSGSVVVYLGMVHQHSRGKEVASLEFTDPPGTAEQKLREVAEEVRRQWQPDNIAICHRIGRLKVGDINILIAVAAAHRAEAYAACQYAGDRVRQLMPTRKTETYRDGSIWSGE